MSERRYCDEHGVYDSRGFCPHCKIAEMEAQAEQMKRIINSYQQRWIASGARDRGEPSPEAMESLRKKMHGNG